MPLVFMQEGREIPLALFLCVVEVETKSKEAAAALNLITNGPLLWSLGTK